jgi:hypothetical protein
VTVKLAELGISSLWLSVALFVAAPASRAADSVASSVLLRSCKVALSDDAKKDPQGVGMFCLGYLGGFADMYAVVQGVVLEEHRKELMCIPATVDVEEMVGVIVKYVESQPKLQSEPARVTAAVALAKAYPCGAK